MSDVTPISGNWSKWPRTEPPELAEAKHRGTEADRKRFAKVVNSIEAKIRKGLGKLKATVQEIKEHERSVTEADSRIKAAQERIARRIHLGRRGETGRTVPTWLYALCAIGFYVIMLIVDRGALLALGLSLGLTTALAIAVPAVDLLCAHTSGGYLWRRQEAISADVEISPGEHALGIAALVLGIAHAVVVGLIRALRSGLLGGLLFGIVALALFAGMTYLAYRHEDDDAAELGRAKRSRWWSVRRKQERERKAEKQAAAVRSDGQKRISIGGERVARWDAAVASGTYSFEERKPGESYYLAPDPAWVEQERRIAAGTLPDHLLPYDARSWVDGAWTKETPELEGSDHRRSA
ncbi:MAG: hypothetical protein JJLCMIEE_02712 [Acidimicrobiales bacterium]|nr:hypothetical protein [Acidimicrobiales bacterium]